MRRAVWEIIVESEEGNKPAFVLIWKWFATSGCQEQRQIRKLRVSIDAPTLESVIVAFLRKRNFLFPFRRATYGLSVSFTTHLTNILLTSFVFISSIALSLHLHSGQQWTRGVVSLWWDLLVAQRFSQAFSALISIRKLRMILEARVFPSIMPRKSLPKAFFAKLWQVWVIPREVRRSASIMIRASVVRDEREIPSLFISSSGVFSSSVIDTVKKVK